VGESLEIPFSIHIVLENALCSFPRSTTWYTAPENSNLGGRAIAEIIHDFRTSLKTTVLDAIDVDEEP